MRVCVCDRCIGFYVDIKIFHHCHICLTTKIDIQYNILILKIFYHCHIFLTTKIDIDIKNILSLSYILNSED